MDEVENSKVYVPSVQSNSLVSALRGSEVWPLAVTIAIIGNSAPTTQATVTSRHCM